MRASVVQSVASVRLVRAYPLRAALVWAALHAFIAAGVGSIAAFGVKGTIFLAATAAVITSADSRRRRETGFLGNLGVPAQSGAVIAAATVVALELLLAAVLMLRGM